MLTVPSIPRGLETLHSNQRILVVDDQPASRELTAATLALTFPPHLKNYIDTAPSPEVASSMMEAAVAGSKPYTLTVVDLLMHRMSPEGPVGQNGDEFLRELAGKKALTSTVVYSGSWSGKMRMAVTKELEKLQQSAVIEDALAGRPPELKNVPIFFVDKTGLGDSGASLTRASEAALVLGRSIDWDQTNQFLSTFAPAYERFAIDQTLLAGLVESIRNMRAGITLFFLEFSDRFPEAADTETIRQFSQHAFLRDEMWEPYSAEAFQKAADAGDTRRLIHDFGLNVGLFSRYSVMLTHPGNLKRSATISALNLGAEFDEFLAEWHSRFNEIYAAFQSYRFASRNEKNLVWPASIIKSLDDDLTRLDLRDKVRIVQCNDKVTTFSDPGLVEASIFQLLMNAGKFVTNKEDGKVVLGARTIKRASLSAKIKDRLALLDESSSEDVIEMWVEDNGPGIPRQNLEKIFEDDFSTTGGTGFGLSFIRSQEKRLNGICEVRNVRPTGARFSLYFPRLTQAQVNAEMERLFPGLS